MDRRLVFRRIENDRETGRSVSHGSAWGQVRCPASAP